MTVQQFRWDQLSEVPEQAGLYAWYYKLNLRKRDILAAKSSLSDIAAADVPPAVAGHNRRGVIRRLLETLLRAVGETDYWATLSGDLKRSYSGTLQSSIDLSDQYVDQIAQDPDILDSLRSVLPGMSVHFLPPLYIGISGNLRRRILQHRKLMEPHRSMQPRVELHEDSDLTEGERAFALEVRRRRLTTNDLLVVTKVLPDTADPRVVEYLLNRITNPIYGVR